MSISDNRGNQELPKEWWENVSLDDVAGYTSVVNNLSSEAESANVNLLTTALPLFVVCGGDHTGLANVIESVTSSVCREAVLAKDSVRISNWLDRLMAISGILLKVPNPYIKDVAGVRDTVTQNIISCKQARLKIIKPDLRIKGRQ